MKVCIDNSLKKYTQNNVAFMECLNIFYSN